MMKRITLSLLLAVVVMVMLPLQVFAIAYPDNTVEVNTVYVYNDLLEVGDAAVLINYRLPYAAIPTEPASETYLGVFVDTDGTTQLSATQPYAGNEKGYNYGIMWIYFTAAEVTALSIDRANSALYRIWLSPNPTATWPGAPQASQIGTITDWETVAESTSVALTADVRAIAQTLGTEWNSDSTYLLESVVGRGFVFTAAGEAYFDYAIPNLRVMAPALYNTGTVDPTIEDIDYLTLFGATLTNGTGTVIGSPITLVSGTQTVNASGLGTLVFDLHKGTVGSMTNNTGIVTGSPIDLVAGETTVTVTGIGLFTVVVELDNTQSGITDTVTGTALDLTDAATAFGFADRVLLFSGLVWLVITIIICSAIYVTGTKANPQINRGMGKVTLLVFDICIIGGAVLGLMPVAVAVLMFIGFGFFTGYVLFFRGSSF